MVNGARRGREHSASASGASMKRSLSGSNFSLRPSFQLMAAAWQAISLWRVTVELQAGLLRDFTQSRKSRTCLAGSMPAISGGILPARSAGSLSGDLAVVAGLDPARVALEADRARAEPEPVALLLEAGQAHHQFHAVGVAGAELAVLGPILDRDGVVGIDRPLAEVDGVGRPIVQAPACRGAVEVAPMPLHIAFVVRAEGGRPSQRSQSMTFGSGSGSPGRSGFAGCGSQIPAWRVCSLPSLPLRARFAATWKLSTLRRCMPPW